MLVALHPVDYGVLLLYLTAMVAVGAYFSRQQRSSKDFFLAGRQMGFFPIGLSVMATLLSALSYTGVPGAAYHAGLRFLLLPLCVWLTVPVMLGCVLPLYQRLEIYSVYEYLELRFDHRVRLAGDVIFLFWRLLWLGGVLYAPCKVLVVAAGLDIPVWLLIVVLGIASTLYTFLGGMKAVIWTDVIQTLVMAGGIVLIVATVWIRLPGGPARVWEVAEQLQRTDLLEMEFRWDSYWCFWGAVPHFALSMLSFYVADQITAQRFLTARNIKAARQSFLLNCLSVSLMIPALMYAGLALLAHYQDHPEDMRPQWVANLDGETRQSLTIGDRRGADSVPAEADLATPLLPWDDPKYRLNRETVDRIVAERRLLHPNNREPFTSADALRDDRNPEGLSIGQLALYYPPHGEIAIHTQAKDELLPWFIRTRIPWGIAGLILAALFAASMSSMDSGLNSLCTLLITDLHRRLGWGRTWLAQRRGKTAEELTEADELSLARPLVLAIGLAATCFSLAVARIGDIFSIMIAVVNTFGGPLLTIFLIGMFVRRCTAGHALISLVTGTLFTAALVLANQWGYMRYVPAFRDGLNDIWPLTFGILVTAAIAFALSLLPGPRPSRASLRGLVWGIGKWGIR